MLVTEQGPENPFVKITPGEEFETNIAMFELSVTLFSPALLVSEVCFDEENKIASCPGSERASEEAGRAPFQTGLVANAYCALAACVSLDVLTVTTITPDFG